MSILTATVANVPIGHLTVLGLMAEDGGFYVDILQSAEFIGWRTSEILETALQLGCTITRLKVNVEVVEAITLNCFSDIIHLNNYLSNSIDDKLSSLAGDLQALAWFQLFHDSFKPWLNPVTGKVQNCEMHPNQDYAGFLLLKQEIEKKTQVYSHYVYLVTDRKNNVCKIGISAKPEQRLKNLQTGYPFELTLEESVKVSNALEIERKIHEKFSNARLKGEWFALDIVEPINLKFLVKTLLKASNGSTDSSRIA